MATASQVGGAKVLAHLDAYTQERVRELLGIEEVLLVEEPIRLCLAQAARCREQVDASPFE